MSTTPVSVLSVTPIKIRSLVNCNALPPLPVPAVAAKSIFYELPIQIPSSLFKRKAEASVSLALYILILPPARNSILELDAKSIPSLSIEIAFVPSYVLEVTK